jgi:hypothetical protein
MSWFYEGVDSAGRMIPSPAFQELIRRTYEAHGWELQGTRISRAMDANDLNNLDDLNDNAAREVGYSALEAAYRKVRRGRHDTGQATERPFSSLRLFKTSRGLDAWPDETVQKYFDLEKAFAAARLVAREAQ